VALARMFGDRRRMQAGTLKPYHDALQVPGTIAHVLAMVRGWFCRPALRPVRDRDIRRLAISKWIDAESR